MPQTHRYDPHKGPEPSDPNLRLQQLKAELADEQRRLDHVTKQTQALQTDITSLEQSVGEVKTVLTTYGGQIQGFETQLQGLQYFYDQKNKMILAAIGDRKIPIDELIAEYDSETGRMEERFEEIADRLAEAQRESQEATASQNQKQAEYNATKAYAQDLQSKLTDLENLRTQITQADTNTDTASMYFLVLEFQNTLNNTDILSQHQLAQELKRSLGELEEAQERARGTAAELGRVQNEYASQQSALAARKQNRRQQLLAEVQKMYPAPAQASATGSSASTPSAATPGTKAAGTTTSTPAPTATTTPASSSGSASPAAAQK